MYSLLWTHPVKVRTQLQLPKILRKLPTATLKKQKKSQKEFSSPVAELICAPVD
jgi:hypothetical protein